MIKYTETEGAPDLEKRLRDYLSDTRDDWNYILPQELHEALCDGEDIFLLDVRRPEDFEKFHIDGAVNIFWLNILEPENLAKLPKNRRIVIICYVGHSASQTLVLLKLLGYHALVLKYGMGHSAVSGVPISGWMNFSFPVTFPPSTPLENC